MLARVAVAGAVCCVVAACGSSGPTPGASATGAQPSSSPNQIAFAKCMRSHGIPSFPDPGAVSDTGNTVFGIGLPADIDFQSPAFQAGMQGCQRLVRGKAPRPGPDPQRMAALVRQAQCMRTHGVPNYPDPSVQNGPIVVGDVSDSPQSPAFEHAAKLCGTDGSSTSAG
jgi:hypothetical protein